ncbi:MAG: hypothetical protein FH756_17835 [Firmicutes bacterium]|nr:hypothetical protein [Bacillota bacterium]
MSLINRTMVCFIISTLIISQLLIVQKSDAVLVREEKEYQIYSHDVAFRDLPNWTTMNEYVAPQGKVITEINIDSYTGGYDYAQIRVITDENTIYGPFQRNTDSGALNLDLGTSPASSIEVQARNYEGDYVSLYGKQYVVLSYDVATEANVIQARDAANDAKSESTKAKNNAANAKVSADAAKSSADAAKSEATTAKNKASIAANRVWDSAENKSAATLSKEARDKAIAASGDADYIRLLQHMHVSCNQLSVIHCQSPP